MTPEYIFLLFASLLPIIYRYNLWLIKGQEFKYDTQAYLKHLVSPEGKQIIYNFWYYIEILLLIFAIRVFFTPLYEIFFYKIYFYFLILMNIFIIGKIIRKKISFPKYDIKTICLTIIGAGGIFAEIYTISHYYPNLIYTYISILLLLSPLVVYLGIVCMSFISNIKK